MTDALIKRIHDVPNHARRSLAWAQGKEMSGHQTIKIHSGPDVSFCDPHSPWQQGSNENTNGLLRPSYPNGTDCKTVTNEQLDAAADGPNRRPRETLGWRSPTEVYAETVVRTP